MSPRRSQDCTALDALGSPIRRRIVALLGERERSVGDLAAKLPVSRPAVSKHLRVLEGAGLVTCETKGTRHLYRLEAGGFAQAHTWLCGFWDEGLARFKLLAENTQPRRRRD